MPRTVPSPCWRQRQASACAYVYPSIPPRDSRAPPPSPHHHLVSSLVVGTPRYAQWGLVVVMAHGDLRHCSCGCGCIRAVCADDDRRLCSVRRGTLAGRWLWGLRHSRRWVGGKVMIGGMRWLRGVLVVQWMMEGGCGDVAVQGSLDEPEGGCRMLEDASVAHV
jgi:hypothetical protein